MAETVLVAVLRDTIIGDQYRARGKATLRKVTDARGFGPCLLCDIRNRCAFIRPADG